MIVPSKQSIITTKESPSSSYSISIHREKINEQIRLTLDLQTFLRKKIEVFIKLGEKRFQGGVNTDSLEALFDFINSVFSNFDIKKLYKSSDKTGFSEYFQMPLQDMFIHNITPYKRSHNDLQGARGGNCIHWALLFYKLVQHLDTQNILDIQIISMNRELGHVACVVKYKDDVYILDPFCKEDIVVKKLKIGFNIFSGVNAGNAHKKQLILHSIFSLNPLILEDQRGELLHPEYFSPQEIIEANENFNFGTIVQVRTYFEEKKYDFLLEKTPQGVSLLFKEEYLGDGISKEFRTKKDIPKGDFLEGLNYISANMTSFEILKYLFPEMEVNLLSKIDYVSHIIEPISLYHRLMKVKASYLS